MSATPASVQPRAVLTTAASALVAGLALVAGDAAMAGTAAAANAVVPGPASTAWLAAAAVIAAGSYALVGAPQIALGRRQTEPLKDRRSRWAVRLLGGSDHSDDHSDDHGKSTRRPTAAAAIAFVVASIVAGPLAVGWFTGRHHHPKAHQRTAAAAALFGCTWAAVYLGVATALL